MIGPVYLAYRRVVTAPFQSALLAACIALALSVPVTTQLLVSGYERDLRARADATPLVAGASGSRFDLMFSTLYFRDGPAGIIPKRAHDAIRADDSVRTIPVHRRFTARSQPLVGVGFDYFAYRGLSPKSGSLPAMLGDAVLGASAARGLNLTTGETIATDQTETYQLAGADSLVLNIVGELNETGTPDDDAVFVDIRTAWLVEGKLHAHRDAAEVQGHDLLARDEQHTVLNPTLIEQNTVNPETAASFHFHGDEGDLPLTGIIVLPDDEKASTIVRARTNSDPALQMIAPAEVVDELLGFAFQIKAVFDTLGIILGVTTLALIGLVGALTWRVRAAEARTLAMIGVSRASIGAMYALELGIILLLGIAFAAALTLVGVGLGAGIIRTL